MLEMVQAGLADRVKEERHNLFSNLLAANDEDVEVNLLISEVVSEIFTHSPHLHRTSHTLTRQAMYSSINWWATRQQPIPLHLHLQCWCYILIPDKQEKLYEHVKNVLPVKTVMDL